MEYALETRLDADFESDAFLDDFLLTHTLYLPSNELCNLLKQVTLPKTFTTKFIKLALN